jgi:hypothetical protein
MSSHPMSDQKAIEYHLYGAPSSQGKIFTSGLLGPLKNIREATGRDIEHGRKCYAEKHGNWLGALGYMVLLDQIGSCFKPLNPQPLMHPNDSEPQQSEYLKALFFFSPLTPDERNALYALRNAFAHDFSLYNIPYWLVPPATHKYLHHFTVNSDPYTKIVTLPQQAWDGDLNNMIEANRTNVNLQTFGDLVEGICAELYNLAEKHQLEIVLKYGAEELIKRYSLVYEA